jgi:hypothetical protein
LKIIIIIGLHDTFTLFWFLVSGLWNVSYEKDVFNQMNYNDLISRLKSLTLNFGLNVMGALNINENLNNDCQES